MPRAFSARLEAEAGEVEEAQQRGVAQIEEEVRRARVVPVLDQLDQRKTQQTLVELDRGGWIGADQGGMVDASTVRRRSLLRWQQVPLT